MRKTYILLLPFLLIVVLSNLAHAQRITGGIKGTVSDEEGGPLPGVNITLQSPALIGGPQSDTTGVDGGFRFPALPPGAYRLSFELTGFQTVVHDQVRVTVGSTIEQNVTMKLAQVSEQLVISGETPLVDPTKPGFSTNYTREYIENTPIARFTFFDFVQMAPGSSPMRFDNTAFSHSILGSNTNENMYQMDGTDLTSALTGAAWPWPNTDIIEEIEILDIGAPAEYGNYQGAVINVVTKSGGNEYHGDANYYWQTQGLTGNNAEIGGIPFHRDRYRDFTFQMGGPILKDKLWFFGGVQTRREHFSQPGTPPESPVKEDDDRYFFKFTYDVNPSNKLQFSLHNDYYNIPEPVTVVKPIETALVETGNNPTPNVMWTSTLNDKSILEVRYAGFYGHDVGEPQTGNFVSGHYDFYTGYYSGGILSWYDGDIWKSQVSGKLSYYADNFMGADHDFRFGVQYTNAGTDYIYAYTNGVKFYNFVYYGYNYPYNYFQTPYHTGADVNSIGLFVDDTMTLSDHLTLNLGLRFDRSKGSRPDFPRLNDAGQETGETVLGADDLASWNVVSPRVGLTYQFPFEKATQIRAHYGRYYQALLTPYIRNRALIKGFPADPETGELGDISFLRDPSQFEIDRDLKDPYTDQFAVGVDHEVAKGLAISGTYIYKRSRDFIGTVTPPENYERITVTDPVTGQPIEVFNQISDPTTIEGNHFLITNPDFFHEEYHGFVLSVTKQMTNWQLTGSLTISRTRGLHAGSGIGPYEDQDSSFFPFDNSIYGQDPNDYINADGLLNGDRKYIFKLQGTYRLPWDLALSGNYSVMSGRPFARQIAVLLDQGIRTIFAEERDGSRRTDTVNLLDMRLEKAFQINNSFAVAVTADLFNVFNNSAFLDVATTLSGPGTEGVFGVGSIFVPPRRLMLGAKLRF
jgi:outer membrane receptor protein involved in Fe transport